MSFQSIDFFHLDDQLSTDEMKIRQNIRSFVDQSIMPIIADCFENQRFPKELIPEFAKLGVFGSTIKGYGCAGVNYTSYGLMMQEIERADSGLRSFVSVQGALCMFPISAYANEELKKKYLPEMAKGKLIGCFGLTEPDFGSNPSGMTTTVRKQGDKFILNGHKRWLTNGGIADLAIVWAKDEEGKVRGFIVDRDLPGITVNLLEKRLSLRASVSSEYIFKDVPVPATHQLNIKGLKGPFSCLNNARYGISWGVLGAAQDCYQRALEYTQKRSQFGGPLVGHQLVQAKLVEMFTDITLAQMLALHLGRLKDQDKASPEQISMAKMNNVSKALKIARVARDLLGANGILGDFHIARHMMNLESVNTYEGTEDIHRLVLGQYITGLAAFK
jgi:glutaryl-CoA dehydrogenase